MAGIGTDPERDADEPLEAEQELAFADVGDRLPWLESDDEDDDPGGGVDTGRLVAFAVVGLMAVVVLLGAMWWLTRAPPEENQLAAGGTIAAPAGPYKVKPADPGGRQVAGTGDTSFAVAEGREVQGRIAEPATPAPSATATVGSAAPVAASGVIGVQVGAYSTQAQAEAGWTQLTARLDPLHGRNHRVVEGVADSGTVFRLQAVTGGAAEAETLCRAIKAAGGDCQVKR
ncbi:MAG: SPOR domain-containing protein [Croceibacterium sp.]